MKSEHLIKILAVERIMKQYPYGITVDDILYLLEKRYAITAERKSIYSNIAVLSRFMQIDKYKAGNKTYWCTRKDVESG